MGGPPKVWEGSGGPLWKYGRVREGPPVVREGSGGPPGS